MQNSILMYVSGDRGEWGLGEGGCLGRKMFSPPLGKMQHRCRSLTLLPCIRYCCHGGDLVQVPVGSWFDDMSDTELRDLIPFFEKLSKVDDVYSVLRNSNNAAATAATGGGGGMVSPAFPAPPGAQMNGSLQSS